MSSSIQNYLKPKHLIQCQSKEDQILVLNECAKAGFQRIATQNPFDASTKQCNSILVLDENRIQEVSTEAIQKLTLNQEAVTVINVKDIRAGVM